MFYQLIDKYLNKDFTKLIGHEIKNNKYKEKINIFDVGCYVGNFSKKINLILKKDYNLKFYLFDPNPSLNHSDPFNFFNLAISNSDKENIPLFINSSYPASGTSLNQIIKNDKLWNFSRNLLKLNFKNNFTKINVQTKKLDTFCYENNIKEIDILKIDVEGAGLEVLNGSKNILNNVNIILIEILDNKKKFETQFNSVRHLLEKNNFKLIKTKKINSVSILSNQTSCDCLYIKKK